eukprot:TRINITY_DN804_c0_g1_i1.p1 TRINITY_DN804_c0_g1~~TRINITY_DN804_c0_g1_i1.p1  ORF type:complete len:316 (-),score=174.80 TRINITY_DN804_c0_g1_i1:109-1056(-)
MLLTRTLGRQAFARGLEKVAMQDAKFMRNPSVHAQINKRFFSSTNTPRAGFQRVGGFENIMKNHSVALIAAGSGIVGTGALVAYGFQQSEKTNQFAADKALTSRLRYSFMYLGGGLALTAGFARSFFRSHAFQMIMARNPIAASIGGFIAVIGSSILTQSISYKESPLAKHLSWAGFNLLIGASLSPIVVVGGPLLLKAAAATACIVGSLSAVAAADPTESFLNMAGPLTIGLGVVIASSLGSIFFPASTLLSSICLYGGTAVFSGFVLVDTQKMIQRARLSRDFDPINACMGLYMDTINLFVRMVTILSSGNRK